MTEAEAVEAAAHLRAAADAATVAREFDITRYVPVHRDDMAAVIKALQSMQNQLDQIQNRTPVE